MPSCKTPQGLKTHAPNSPPPSPQPATPNRTSRSRPPHTHPCRVVSHSTLGTARHRPIGRGRCLFGGEITHEKNTISWQFCRRTCYIGFCTRRCTQMELKKKKKNSSEVIRGGRLVAARSNYSIRRSIPGREGQGFSKPPGYW